MIHDMPQVEWGEFGFRLPTLLSKLQKFDHTLMGPNKAHYLQNPWQKLSLLHQSNIKHDLPKFDLFIFILY